MRLILPDELAYAEGSLTETDGQRDQDKDSKSD
jgi:hypothetical protein